MQYSAKFILVTLHTIKNIATILTKSVNINATTIKYAGRPKRKPQKDIGKPKTNKELWIIWYHFTLPVAWIRPSIPKANDLTNKLNKTALEKAIVFSGILCNHSFNKVSISIKAEKQRIIIDRILNFVILDTISNVLS